MSVLIPSSYGAVLSARVREFNPCHAPAGTRVGGQFCGEKTAATIPFTFKDWDETVVKELFGRVMTQAQFAKIASAMVAQVDGVTFRVEVKAWHERRIGSAYRPGYPTRPAVNLMFIGNDGDINATDEADKPTSLVRTFYLDDQGKLAARHTAFEKKRTLPPGFGKDMLRGHLNAYEQLKVQSIDTYANIDVGAYAWAKYGFVASDPDEVSSELSAAVDKVHGTTVREYEFATHTPTGKGVGIGDSEARMLKSIAATRSPFMIWEFADATLGGVKVGKAILTNGEVGWTGNLDLSGRTERSVKQLARFWSYVGRTKTPPSTATREAFIRLVEVGRGAIKPGELCEWDPEVGRYTDQAIWAELLDGDHRSFYDLADPSARAGYRAALPRA